MAVHNSLNINVLETLYFRIRVTLNDDDFQGLTDNTLYTSDYDPTIPPTQEIFPPLYDNQVPPVFNNDNFALIYACYNTDYEFEYSDVNLGSSNPPLPPKGYVFKR